MKLLGLDFGERRIGVAVSDPLGALAQPATAIERASMPEDIEKINWLIRRHQVNTIVLGLPLSMDGTVGTQAKRVKRFAGRLKRELHVEVVLWDERLSTVEAERSLLEADLRRAERRATRDSVAAALVLQSYLDAQQRSRNQ